MRFRLLGPLHVLRDDIPIPLGGISRRATLGYLLLHTNDVVSTGQLLQALWGEEAPPTARKILQNAVSGLRRALADGSGEGRSDGRADGRSGGPRGSETLLTHAPGYVLRADPAAVDLCEFRELSRRGQTALALGRWDEADHQLRRALALWNGPALADLAEGGYDWPELTALQNDRFTVLEDRMEAALAAGRHVGILGELEAVVSAEPLRERLCRQLMLALYRSGRQAEALGVYRRTRAALVEELGLDPGPELRELERAILDHDPALWPSGGAAIHATSAPTREPTTRRTPAAAPSSTSAAASGSASASASASASVEPAVPAASARASTAASPSALGSRRRPTGATEPSPSPPATAVRTEPSEPGIGGGDGGMGRGVGGDEQKRVTAVFVRVETPAGITAPEAVEQLLDEARAVVRDRARRAGGSGLGELGPLSLCVFGADRVREDDALRAVRTAVELAGHTGAGFRLRVAVATGEALVAAGGEPFDVTGRLFQTGLDLLFAAAPGAVRVCDATRGLCAEQFGFETAAAPSGGHDVTVPAPTAPTARPEPPFVDRDRELHQLAWWAQEVRRSGRPHLVTVLGEAGIGKSRLVRELRRTLAETDGPRCLIGANTALRPEEPYVCLAEVVRSYVGVADGDSELGRDHGLRDAVSALVGPGRIAAQLTDGLRRLIARPGGSACHALPSAEDDSVFLAWRRLVEELAAREPLVVVLEDLERVDDAVSAFVGGLVEAVGELPLLVVVTARPELADRTAYWAAGRPGATTLTLEPLPRPAIDVLLDGLLPAPGDGGATAELRATLAERSGGNPLFAIEYAGSLANGSLADGPHPGGRIPVPPAVHSVVSARIDTLPEAEKTLLYDASLFDGSFLDLELAALGQASGDTSETLAGLERRGFLRRCRRCPDLGAVEYQFVHDLVAEVAYARLPHTVRADKHLRAARWLAAQPDRSPALVLHHCRRAVHHAAAARRPDGDVSGRVGALLLEAGQLARERGAVGAAEYYYRVAQEFSPVGRPQWLRPLHRRHEAKSPA
ncbi:AAA family ATPase [Streptomyces sp. NBC_01275]|uniref:BTAD domain-containing putative transcriptional regulator n=1 Tax=Streptomyces sp. NBC_01275 TaxID=2903807 RepID=UPI00225B67DE|nr:BTAD domain-containing putative transcriptional regulator [Streptomyces sp. NBC_01275]MCX4761558.1 AAA family ATPase [Streptomyces sp. NBC_01275]